MPPGQVKGLELGLGPGLGSYTMNSTDTRPQLQDHNMEIVVLYTEQCENNPKTALLLKKGPSKSAATRVDLLALLPNCGKC